MSQPPSLTRFNIENYEGAPEWFALFIADLNTPLGQLADAVGGDLVRGDNVRGQKWSKVRVSTGASVTADASPFPIFLKLDTGFVPEVLLLGKISLPANATLPTDAIQPYWETTNDGRIKIRYLSGLAASTVYTFNFIAE